MRLRGQSALLLAAVATAIAIVALAPLLYNIIMQKSSAVRSLAELAAYKAYSYMESLAVSYAQSGSGYTLTVKNVGAKPVYQGVAFVKLKNGRIVACAIAGYAGNPKPLLPGEEWNTTADTNCYNALVAAAGASGVVFNESRVVTDLAKVYPAWPAIVPVQVAAKFEPIQLKPLTLYGASLRQLLSRIYAGAPQLIASPNLSSIITGAASGVTTYAPYALRPSGSLGKSIYLALYGVWWGGPAKKLLAVLSFASNFSAAGGLTTGLLAQYRGGWWSIGFTPGYIPVSWALVGYAPGWIQNRTGPVKYNIVLEVPNFITQSKVPGPVTYKSAALVFLVNGSTPVLVANPIATKGPWWSTGSVPLLYRIFIYNFTGTINITICNIYEGVYGIYVVPNATGVVVTNTLNPSAVVGLWPYYYNSSTLKSNTTLLGLLGQSLCVALNGTADQVLIYQRFNSTDLYTLLTQYPYLAYAAGVPASIILNPSSAILNQTSYLPYLAYGDFNGNFVPELVFMTEDLSFGNWSTLDDVWQPNVTTASLAGPWWLRGVVTQQYFVPLVDASSSPATMLILNITSVPPGYNAIRVFVNLYFHDDSVPDVPPDNDTTVNLPIVLIKLVDSVTGQTVAEAGVPFQSLLGKHVTFISSPTQLVRHTFLGVAVGLQTVSVVLPIPYPGHSYTLYVAVQDPYLNQTATLTLPNGATVTGIVNDPDIIVGIEGAGYEFLATPP